MGNIEKNFVENLNYWMKRTGTKQQELADALNVTRQAVSNYLAGSNLPRIGKIDEICAFFKIKRTDLLDKNVHSNNNLICKDNSFSIAKLDVDSVKIGDVIKQFRDARGLSMDVFAKLSGLSKAYISLLEKGVNNQGEKLVPSITTLRKVAKVMGADVNDLIELLDENIMKPGDIIRTLREGKGMSQADLAKALRKSRSIVSMYEANKRVPSTYVLQDLGDIFNVDTDYILGKTTKTAVLPERLNHEEKQVLYRSKDFTLSSKTRRLKDGAENLIGGQLLAMTVPIEDATQARSEILDWLADMVKA